jgi:hypothetical protein
VDSDLCRFFQEEALSAKLMVMVVVKNVVLTSEKIDPVEGANEILLVLLIPLTKGPTFHQVSEFPEKVN